MRTVEAALLICILLFIFPVSTAVCAESPDGGGACGPSAAMDKSGICGEAGADLLQPAPDATSLVPLSREFVGMSQYIAVEGDARDGVSHEKETVVYFFHGRGCPHCEEERRYLEKLKKIYPTMEIRDYEVWYDKKNAALLSRLLTARGVNASGVPVTIIDDRIFIGFSAETRRGIDEVVRTCSRRQCDDPSDAPGKMPDSSASRLQEAAPGSGSSVELPLLGNVDARYISLPVMTIVLAGLDSFNPCAFFVLLSLLGLLVHARSRKKMMLVGCVFVFFSGFLYFVFMAAWLNLFLVLGQVAVITAIAGAVSVVIAVINIKDFFLFKKGVSLTLPERAKPKLFGRMRGLMQTASLPSILAGTTVLAVVANSYELLCTAGFPMVFTRVLTLRQLSLATYYLYLILYNVVYVLPLLFIVLAFTLTLGSRKLSEWQGRVLKLLSGTMMLGLGGVLLTNPALLNSLAVSVVLLTGAVALTLAVATATRRMGYR